MFKKLEKLAILVAAPSFSGSAMVFADAPTAVPPGKAPGPCEQIVAACKSAGFVQGDNRQRYDLHVECIDPMMRGTKQPARRIKRCRRFHRMWSPPANRNILTLESKKAQAK